MKMMYRLFLPCLFCVTLFLMGGCGSESSDTLLPIEQKEADKYIADYGKNAIVQYMATEMLQIQKDEEGKRYDKRALFDTGEKRILKYLKYFVSQGADVNAIFEDVDLDQKRIVFTPLFLAVDCGNVDIIKYLVSQGADVNVKDVNEGYSPFMYMLEINSKCNVDIVSFFVSHGANVNARTFGNTTPLHLAVRHGDSSIEVVKCLIEKGANVNAKTNDGETPLHKVFFNTNPSSIEVVKYLIEKGADVNAKGLGGYTPLHLAVLDTDSSIEVVKCLIEKGADVNAKTDGGGTPLDLAKTDEKKNILRAAGGKSGSEL